MDKDAFVKILMTEHDIEWRIAVSIAGFLNAEERLLLVKENEKNDSHEEEVWTDEMAKEWRSSVIKFVFGDTADKLFEEDNKDGK